MPFAITVLMSRMEGFDKSLEEASLDLGENGWMTFWRVTFPLVLPGIVSACLLTFMVSFDDFLIAYFLAGTQVTLPIYIWAQLRFPYKLPDGAGAGRADPGRVLRSGGGGGMDTQSWAAWPHRGGRLKENVVNDAYIRIDNVTKRFGGVTAVDAANVDIRRGEFFSLLGPSGCGKTTLLRMIAGFDFPTEGDDPGRRPRHHRHCRRNKRPSNMVFQSYAIFPHLNVFDNIAYGLREIASVARGVEPPRRRKRSR